MKSSIKYTGIAFLVVAVVTSTPTSHAFSIHGGEILFNHHRTVSVSSALFAGFGKQTAGSNNKNNKKGKKTTSSTTATTTTTAALKPKSQWDRFMALKQSTAVKVGVRVVVDTASSSSTDRQEGGSAAWMEVGRVRAQEDTLDGQIAALVAQRGLVAEHAKRLFPLQISIKDRVEWGFQSESNEWVAVNVKDVNVESIDAKTIGFEGRPDPASGYYCHYDVTSKGTKVLNLEYEKGEPNSKGARAL
jgi:hypothetical protein